MDWAHDVGAFVLRHRHLSPDRVAIDRGVSAVTYGELGNMVDAMAARLEEAGLASDDLVLLTSDDELTLLVSVLGISAAGGVCMVLRRAMLSTAVTAQVLRFRPKFLVTDHLRFQLPGVHTMFVQAGDLLHSSTQGASRLAHKAPVNLKNFCLVVGSGSTGQSKLFFVTHRQEFSHLLTRVKAYELTSTDHVGSFTHVEFTTARRHVFSALCAGSTVKLFSKDNEMGAMDLLHSDVSVLHVPVVTLHGLLKGFGNNQQCLRNLRILGTGGSTVSEELRHGTDQHLTKHLHVVYGTNELGFLTIAKPEDWRFHPGSIGRPIEGVEMEVVDAKGTRVASGQPGLLRFRKVDMMTEYLDSPEMTARSFYDGWFCPHDVGSVGADGVVRFLGRADDMMIFNGINIYPSEIERCMRAMPGLRDVAAVPLQHPVHQDVPVCAVVLDEGIAVDTSRILEWGHRTFGTVAPKFVVILENIPRDEQGKLLRPQLRKILLELIQ